MECAAATRKADFCSGWRRQRAESHDGQGFDCPPEIDDNATAARRISPSAGIGLLYLGRPDTGFGLC